MKSANNQLKVLLGGCLIAMAGEFLCVVGGNCGRQSNLR